MKKMTCLIFARWFGIVSIILAFGILMNLEDAREMAKNLVKTETGYIMGGVLPVIFGSLPLLFTNSFQMGWTMTVTLVGAAMLIIGIFRVVFVQQWKALMSRHIEQIPFLFSLFGLMFGFLMLYVGFVAHLVG